MADGFAGVLTLLPSFEGLAILAVRSAALGLLGWLGAALLRRSLPSARQALWTVVIVGLVTLPVLTLTLPAWRILPAGLSSGRGAAPSAGWAGPRVASETQWTAYEMPSEPVLPVGPIDQPGWREWAVVLWAGGTLVAALAFAAGLWRLRRVRLSGRRASPRLVQQAAGAAADFGVRRPVRVLISPRVASPATWGLCRPVIVLPPAAARWSTDRCRLVLAHEMAHVARGDWGWRLLAQVGCVAYWLNPLAWIAARRLRFEQELACDLEVVARGARPSRYAHHLLNIARAGAAGRALPLVALDMARRSQMEGRLMSILAARPARRLHRGLLLPALSVALALPVVAAVQPQAPPAPEAALAAPAAIAGEAPVAPAAPEDAPLPAEAPVIAAEPAGAPAPPVAPFSAARPDAQLIASPSPAPVPSAVVAPVLAPGPLAAPQPALAPSPSMPAGSIQAVLAASDVVAPAAPVPAFQATVGAAPEAPVPPVAPSDPAVVPEDLDHYRELDARIAAKAEEIEALMAPIHEEIERAMEEGMGEMLEQMEAIELEMRPVHEEMSRLGEEMSRRAMESMPVQLEIEEHARRAELIAREIEERSRLAEGLIEVGELDREALERKVQEMNEALAPLREQLGALQLEMRDRHLVSADLQELLEPFREQMEELRLRLAPQRERMEALRQQFEPRREEMERLRERHLVEVRERLDALRAELQELSEERARERREER